ncbi:MAG: DUF2339 domain-containing protein, partial [Verrucomicrobiota bacterium]
MQWVFVAVLVLGVPIVVGVWLISRAVQSQRRIEELSRRLGALERDVFRLKSEKESAPAAKPTPAAEAGAAPPVAAGILQPSRESAPPRPVQPPVPPQPIVMPKVQLVVPPIATPPPISVTHPTPKPATLPPRKPIPAVNWEQFMGVKMFAWIGGLALFLGVAFFVKYSFEHNWVPPELRVALGFITGLGLLVGGVVLHRRKQYIVGAQALCATGVVILYAVTFACRSIYHFEFFGVIPTFLLMVLITTTAFFVAVRLNALVVAVLGMLGGFLTPYLLSTGQDNPLGLFGYLAILDAGLIVVALNRRWFFLTALAAVGTAIMQVGWANQFFTAEKYFEGNKILVALAVLLGF